MCDQHAMQPENYYCVKCWAEKGFVLDGATEIDDWRVSAGCILCQTPLYRTTRVWQLQTDTTWVMICSTCYDENRHVVKRLIEMSSDWYKYNNSPHDHDDERWTNCNKKCSGICGNPNCESQCWFKYNHKWSNNIKSQKVCWCGKIVDQDQSDDVLPERVPLPLDTTTQMEHNVKFRECPRFGDVPLLHYCDHCDPESDNPCPLRGPDSRCTHQAPSSSSSGASSDMT